MKSYFTVLVILLCFVSLQETKDGETITRKTFEAFMNEIGDASIKAQEDLEACKAVLKCRGQLNKK